MLYKLCLSFLLVPLLALSQNPPVCDSVYIDCCNSNQINSTSITIEVSNYSSYLFPYPGFIILDDNNDTIGIETVNYYGIPPYPQPHVIEFTSPPELPFTGSLELHSLFYDTLNCVFAINIPDTTLTASIETNINKISIFPNPAREVIYIDTEQYSLDGRLAVAVINYSGAIEFTEILNQSIHVIQTDRLWTKGLYLLRINNNEGKIIQLQKILVK